MSLRSFAIATTTLVLIAWAEKDAANCENGAVPSEGHQLLQKIFRNEGKVNHTAERHSQSPVCTSLISQGRCWYLSELGEDCATTCAKNGFGFSYVVADPKNEITKALIGHEPAAKQEAWAALECYVPSEDRFHLANGNAGKHFEDVGTWSAENCKLACPCGNTAGDIGVENCGWKLDPACAPTYVYKGTTYTGCATVDSEHGKPWCQHNYLHKDGDINDWSPCQYKCAGDSAPVVTTVPTAAPSDGCGWKLADSCVPEMDYEGTHYIGCTDVDHENPWCSNTNPYRGAWQHCVYTCPNGPVTTPAPAPVDDTLCTWDLAPECSRAFQYKGIDYTDCVTFDHPTPWCSLDRIHKGSWTKCTRTCIPAGAAPTTVPTTSEDPCTRHPDVENDNIGNTVTLDEIGYQTAATADSPINMKRFICRVVSKIGCKVNDLSSLLAFVPYYSGVAGTQTYSRMETELITKCHAGGLWVSPA